MAKTSINEVSELFSKPKRLLLASLVLLSIALGLLLPMVISSNTLTRIVLTRNYEPGDLSDEDVISPQHFEFIDEVATEEARKIAAQSVLPIFSFSLQDTIWSKAASDVFVSSFKEGGAAIEQMAKDYELADLDKLYEKYLALPADEREQALLLTRDFVRNLIEIGVFSGKDIRALAEKGFLLASVENYGEDGNGSEARTSRYLSSLYTDSYLYDAFTNWISSYKIRFSGSFIQFVYEAANMLVRPNYYYDETATELEKTRVAGEVEDVTIEINRGEYIMKLDTLVTEQQLRTINRINSIKIDYPITEMIGRTMLLACITITCVISIIRITERKYRVPTFSIAFMGSFVFVLILSYIMIRLARNYNAEGIMNQFMPFLFMPLLLTHLTNKKTYGVIAGVLFAAYMLFLSYNNMVTFFYFIFLSVVSILFVRFGVNRIDMIFQAFYTALTCSIITMFFHLLNSNPLSLLFTEILTISLNVAITYVLLSIILPIIEHITNIPTVFRLHELCTTDSPTLQRMRIAAPGTYNHVNNVADMAYEAIKEIGGNAELAKVGGLYHDIGKVEHPEYFVENQPKNSHNAHDDIKSTLSAAVLKSHVKLGVEKGKEIGLPQEVIDIIYQHHGNDIIQYFYNEAKKEVDQNKNPYGVNEDDFRYNADPPQSREAAVVMLADCFEAASRTLDRPTSQRYENFFTSILVGKITRNQLNDCGLTMIDLDRIKHVFIHEAIARDHHRIKYDNDKKD